MSRWKYSISLTYRENNSTNIKIPNNNVRKLYKYNDYVENNMATMYCVLDVDKALYDRIILNAKNSTMILTVTKHDVDVTPQTDIVVYDKAECEYFISDDINYNKEIDYIGENKDRQDIYREVYIGLMFKKCLEWNKQTANTTVKDSGMQDIVLKYVENIPTLIEPFQYNEKVEQLIIPPQDSLTKTLAFLNDIKVFYDTQYRVYFEPDCLYIMSSAGKPVPKTTDKNDTVKFYVHAVTDPDANILGMSEKDGYDLVHINAVDTVYNVNNNLAKDFNTIEAITNPSKAFSLSSLNTILGAISGITTVQSEINTSVNDNIDELEEITNMMNKNRDSFFLTVQSCKGITPSTLSYIDEAKALIQAMPEEDSTDPETGEVTEGLDPEIKAVVIAQFDAQKNIITNNTNEYNKIYDNYGDSIAQVVTTLSRISSAGSYLNCISAMNASNNAQALSKNITNVEKGCEEINNYYITTLEPANTQCDNTIRAVNSCINLLSSYAPEGYEEVVSSLEGCNDTYSSIANTTLSNLNKHSKIPSTIRNINDRIKNKSSQLNSNSNTLVDSLKNMAADSLSNIASNSLANLVNGMMNGSVNSIGTAVDNVKGSVTSGINSTVGNITNNINSMGEMFGGALGSLNNIGVYAQAMMQNITNNAKKTAQNLTAHNLGQNALSMIQGNINSVGDISCIAQLGISKFDFGLNLGRINGTGVGIVRINNDNANKVKNIASEMSNKVNTFELNKMDLDVSVFNINKKYIIKNYATHSNKDGLFILDKKMELFIIEDENNYKCSTVLQFRKIMDVASDGSGDGYNGNIPTTGGIFSNNSGIGLSSIPMIGL